LPHYPVAQADAQTFPSSVILNEIEVPAALADFYDRSEKGQNLQDDAGLNGRSFKIQS